MHQKYAGKGVSCISVSIDSAADKDAVLKFLKNQDAAFTNLLVDEPAKVWQKQFDMYGPPAVMVFDRDGKLAANFNHNDPEKSFSYDDVEKVVQKLLAK